MFEVRTAKPGVGQIDILSREVAEQTVFDAQNHIVFVPMQIAALAAHGIGTAYAIEKRCWVCIERARDSSPRVRRKPTRAVTIIASGNHDTRM
jgi:hypothetical protein